MKSCYRNIRKAVAIIAKKVSFEELSPLQVEKPEVLSASGYFIIDMKLFTTVSHEFLPFFRKCCQMLNFQFY